MHRLIFILALALLTGCEDNDGPDRSETQEIERPAQSEPTPSAHDSNVAEKIPSPIDDEALWEVACYVPMDVLSPPLCGNNGPEYDAAMAKQHADYNTMLSRFAKRSDAGQRAIKALKEIGPITKPYQQSAEGMVHRAAIDVILLIKPEGGEAAIEHAIRASMPHQPHWQPGTYSPTQAAIYALGSYPSEEAEKRLVRLRDGLAADDYWRRIADSNIQNRKRN